MSQHAVENTTKERIEMERDLATTSARREEAVAGAHSAEHEYNRASATFQLEFNERQAQNTLKLAELTSQLRKIQTRLQHMLIKSPVDGTVQELAIHTQEGIVTTAQVLMVIVPNDKDVSAELNLPSQEIGFVHEGQKVEIKIDAYPFTTYGMLTGDVRIISKDAISDERSGALSYAVRVNLRQSSLVFASRKLPLVPGMTVSGEILTGQRRFISYFIDPISKQAHEGFRER